MEHDILYTFPLFGLIQRPICTNLALSSDGVVGFGIKALPDVPINELGNASPFQFFCINIITGHASTYGIQKIPVGTISMMRLDYIQKEDMWALYINGTSLYTYELRAKSDLLDSITSQFNASNIATGNISLITTWFYQRRLFYLLSVADLGEVDDQSIYLAQRQALSSEQYTTQYVGRCDTIRSFVSEDSIVLFVLQRPETLHDAQHELQSLAIMWKVKMIVLIPDGTVISEKIIPGFAFPVRNKRFPTEDLENLFDVRMHIGAGPLDSRNQGTCIAALHLQDRSRMSEEPGAVHSALYWIDKQGEILKSFILSSRINTFCACDDRVVIIDIIDGEYRLCSWIPISENKIHVAYKFNYNLKNVRIVKTNGNALYFWCIEESINGIKIAKRSFEHLVELTSVWYEGITLPDTVSEPYPNDAIPCVIVAYQDRLLLLAKDKDQKMVLLEVK